MWEAPERTSTRRMHSLEGQVVDLRTDLERSQGGQCITVVEEFWFEDRGIARPKYIAIVPLRIAYRVAGARSAALLDLSGGRSAMLSERRRKQRG